MYNLSDFRHLGRSVTIVGEYPKQLLQIIFRFLYYGPASINAKLLVCLKDVLT